MGRRKLSFSLKLKAFPVSALGRTDEVVRGGKLILPEAAFPELYAARRGLKSTHTCLGVMSTTTKKETVIGVLECSGQNPEHVFLPDWAMLLLRLQPGDEVKIRLLTLPSASWAKVRLGHEARGVQDIEEALVVHLQGFAALSKGDKFKVHFEQREFELEVLQTKPKNRVRLSAGNDAKLNVEIELDEEPPAPVAVQVEKRKACDETQEAPPVPEKKPKEDAPPVNLTPDELLAMREARIKKFQK